MIRGISSAASGMIAQLDEQDVTANNLANASTSGYKRDAVSFSSVLDGKLGASQTSEVSTQTGADFTQGGLQQTDEPFHMALSGDGFFVVQTANGPAYTRNGAFTQSADGTLATADGDPVMGINGPIRLTGRDFTVDEQGRVFQGKAQVNALQVVQFPAGTPLGKAGNSLWTAGGATPTLAASVRVKQGYLESSNVNTVREMVSMINGLRAYESGQKAITAQDETLDKLVNDVGRVG